MKKILHISIIICLSFIYLFSGCSKDSQTSQEKKDEFYEQNRLITLGIFTPVMYSNEERATGELFKSELFKIVHISDAHVSPWSQGNNCNNPNNIKEAVKFANDQNTRINAMVATGDYISNHLSTTRTEVLNYMNIFTEALYRQNNIPTFTSTGNHDTNMLNPNFLSFALSKTDIYNHLTAKINHQIYSEGIENYYYTDLPNPMGGTIRIIALDVTDQDEMLYTAQHNAILSQKQINWLCHTALKKDMTELHSVIILIHHPLPHDEESLKKIAYNQYLYDWNMLPEIIETFRTKQTLTKKYRNKLLVSDSISVDVSFSNSPGEFVCYLGGHLHTYINYEVKCSIASTLPPQIMIIANNMSPNEQNPLSPIERSETGLQNNTFNLYAIDTKKKMIYVTFFGATGFYYPQVLTLQYLQ